MIHEASGFQLLYQCLLHAGLASLGQDDAREEVVDEREKERFVAADELCEVQLTDRPQDQRLLGLVRRRRRLHGAQRAQQLHDAAQSEIVPDLLSYSTSYIQTFDIIIKFLALSQLDLA